MIPNSQPESTEKTADPSSIINWAQILIDTHVVLKEKEKVS